MQPTTLNAYAYTGGDPVNRRDASGRSWTDIGSAVLGAITGFGAGMAALNIPAVTAFSAVFPVAVPVITLFSFAALGGLAGYYRWNFVSEGVFPAIS